MPTLVTDRSLFRDQWPGAAVVGIRSLVIVEWLEVLERSLGQREMGLLAAEN